MARSNTIPMKCGEAGVLPVERELWAVGRTFGLLVITVLLASCFDDLTAPPATPAAFTQGLTSPWITGCAELQVRLDRIQGRDSVAVTVIDHQCGPLRPVIDTSALKPNRTTVRLPISVVNADSWQVENLQLVSWPDSLVLVAPANLGGTPLTWANPDSTVALDAGEIPSARLWNYAPGQLNGSTQDFGRRWVQIDIDSKVTEVRAHIWLRAQSVQDQLPVLPPSHIPDDIRRNFDFNWQVPNDIVVVQFVSGTSAAAREDAFSVIGGEVIGGIPHTATSVLEGYYLVYRC